MFRKKKAAAAAAKARRRKRRADESGDSDSSEDANGVFNGGNHSVTTAKSDATTGILGSDLVAAVCRSEIKGNVKSDMTGNTTSRRSENDNGNKEGGDGSLQYTTPTTLERILRAKKRRKLLSSLHSRRGVDAASLLTAVAVSAGDPGEANSSFSIPESNLGSESSGLRQRLEGAFGTGSGADGEEEGVLKAKHRDAMETYIRERTGHKKGGVDAGKGVGGNYSTGGAEKLEREAEEAEATKTRGDRSLDEDELYRQIAAEVGFAGVTEAKEDLGSGGMMLAGTGIAEVSLPVDDRIRVARETENAAREKERMRAMHQPPMAASHSTKMEVIPPPNFSTDADTVVASGLHPPPTLPPASSAGSSVLPTDVSGLAQSYAHNFREHSHQWAADRRSERDRQADASRRAAQSQGGTTENQTRKGFAEMRQQQHASGTSGAGGARSKTGASVPHVRGQGHGNRDRDRGSSTDDRVWKAFVSKARNRR
jgi:hypothetical protein